MRKSKEVGAVRGRSGLMAPNRNVSSQLAVFLILGILAAGGILVRAWWRGWDLLAVLLLLVPPVAVLAFIGFRMLKRDTPP